MSELQETNFNSILRGIETKSKTMVSQGDQPEQQILPAELYQNIFEDLKVKSIFRKYANLIQISKSIMVDIPISDGDQYQAVWKNEGENLKELTINGQKVWSKKQIQTYCLFANLCISNEFINDMSINLESFFFNTLTKAFMKEENQKFLYGTGEKQPTGILCDEYKQKIKIIIWNKESKDGAIKAMFDAYANLQSYTSNSIVWVMSRTFFLDLAASDKDYKFLKTIHINGEMTTTLFTFPIILTNDLQGKDQCLLADLSHYCIVERTDMQIIKDPFTNMPDINFTFFKRLGADLMSYKSIILIKNK